MTRKAVALSLAIASVGVYIQAADRATVAASKKRETVEVLFSLNGSQDFGRGIEALRRADVRSDVAQARVRNDRRLIGLMGYALEVPGVQLSPGGEAPSGYTVVVIKGTGDAIASAAQERFQILLQTYAAQYNSGILGQP